MTMSSTDMQDDSSTSAGSGTRRPAGGPRADQPRRRTFTADYKLKTIEEYDAATEPGAKGALLRREGLYDSHIIAWRRARDTGALAALSAKPAGRPKKSAAEVENERLKKQVAKLEAKLEQTHTALEIMGKARALLEMLSESADSPRTSAE
jgi:transposase